MNVLSLFSGIGGIDLGLERAGMSIVGQVEIDEYCQTILNKHWPNVPKFLDIKRFGKEQLDSLPKIDLICGGFPCQNISKAGKREGLLGEKSSLWYEMLGVIALCGPDWVLIENVANIKNNGADEIKNALEVLDYTVQQFIISAENIGASHQRKRYWLVDYSNRLKLRLQSRWWIRKGWEGAFKSARLSKEVMGNSDESIRERCVLSKRSRGTIAFPAGPNAQTNVWECPRLISKSELGLSANGLSRKLVRQQLKALGNAVVPQIPQYIGESIMKVYRLYD